MGAVDRIVAASQRLLSTKNGKRPTAPRGAGRASAAWDMYETVPEVGAYAGWVSGAMGGATLFAGKRAPDGTVVDAPAGSRASELVASIAGGLDGQSTLLGDFGVQLAVPGDCWVVIVPDPDADDYGSDSWYVLSTEEVSMQGDKVRARIDGKDVDIPAYDADVPQDPDAPIAFRVWERSGRRRQEATSPVIRSLTILEELRLLTAVVAAASRSRLTGRGVLLVPVGARFPTQPGQDGAEDSLMDTFIEVASTAIREPDSAAATVPIVLEVPDDSLAGVKWLDFSSGFDALAKDLRDEAIRRFAVGADIPAEIILGMGDVNHWGAWALTAEALRMGAEPRLALVCEAITTEWLQPLLAYENVPDAGEWIVWYDTSGLRSSSNKGANAIEAYKEGLISGVAARRELGYTEKDAPGAADTVPEDGDDATGEAPADVVQSAPDTLSDEDPAVAA